MGEQALELTPRMADCFFYGTLCHPPVLAAVLGCPVDALPAAHPAQLAGHAARWAEGQAHPLLCADPGATTPGIVLRGLGPDAQDRLAYYETGHLSRTMPVTLADGTVLEAAVWAAEPGLWTAGAPWSLADWAAVWGDVVAAAAQDFMALRGRVPAQQVARRWNALLVRAASRVRAAAPAPATLRRPTAPGDVVLEGWRQPYAGFFAVEEADLRFRRFAGGMGAPVTRAAFISGDAAVVLPYDPLRDRVLLVEQFRMGHLSRGASQCWSLEAIAGRVDAGESPEECARREAVEEAGLSLGALLPVAQFYPSPGAIAEYLYTFVGLADLSGRSVRLGGLAEESEDIRGHVVEFSQMMALIDSAEIDNGPLILAAWWLSARRDALRADAQRSRTHPA